MDALTPRRIVEELDKYIIGQEEAKKAVAVALRNRYRRSLLPEEMRDEVIPKNIMMIGNCFDNMGKMVLSGCERICRQKY